MPVRGEPRVRVRGVLAALLTLAAALLVLAVAGESDAAASDAFGYDGLVASYDAAPNPVLAEVAKADRYHAFERPVTDASGASLAFLGDLPGGTAIRRSATRSSSSASGSGSRDAGRVGGVQVDAVGDAVDGREPVLLSDGQIADEAPERSSDPHQPVARR